MIFSPQQQQMMACVIKGVLNTQQRTRTLEGAVADCYIVNTETNVVDDMYETKQQYAQKVMAAGKGHDMGGPDPYMFMTMVSSLHKSDVGGSNKEFLVKCGREMAGKSSHEVAEVVKLCNMQECYESSKTKITIIIADETWRRGII